VIRQIAAMWVAYSRLVLWICQYCCSVSAKGAAHLGFSVCSRCITVMTEILTTKIVADRPDRPDRIDLNYGRGSFGKWVVQASSEVPSGPKLPEATMRVPETAI
jgi:hypothetical protein